MSAVALETFELTKQFGRGKRQMKAVDRLSIRVEGGQVYGFLGPNGAGKTTTIRMILDLVRPTSGVAKLFGNPVHGTPNTLKRVGALVEGASLYPFMTGRQNLEVLSRTNGTFDPKRIQQLIDRVGMSDRADRRAGGYSTGMKQRMGVAAALLNDPDIVILDEPTNGLDPAGILEMRHLIRELAAKDGKTVFLSSHMLNEIEQVCDRVAIINRGQLVREGAVQELLAAQACIRISAEPFERAQSVLEACWPTTAADNQLIVEAQASVIPDVVRRLVTENIDVFEVVHERLSLEAYFLDVTREQENA